MITQEWTRCYIDFVFWHSQEKSWRQKNKNEEETQKDTEDLTARWGGPGHIVNRAPTDMVADTQPCRTNWIRLASDHSQILQTFSKSWQQNDFKKTEG